MEIKYLGHSALLVQTDTIKALIDPFLSGNPQYKEDMHDTLDITHIFITHAHGDHIGDALAIAKKNNAVIIANAEICNILWYQDNTLQLHAMHIGGRFTFDFGTVKMTPALHGSGYNKDGVFQDGGNPCGYVIELGTKKLYHAGDTGLTYDMKLLEVEEIDIAFLPIGGNYTMDSIDAKRAVDFIKPKLTVPMHYNTFGMIKADPLLFKDMVQDYLVKIIHPGETITI